MNQERLLYRFLRYAQCSSESQHEKEICLLLEQELERLKIPFVRDTAAGAACGSDGWNLQVFLPGEGAPMLFSAHMDTVSPGVDVKPQIRDGVIYSDGTTVLGGDDKSGVAAIMEAMQSVLESGKPHRPVEVLFTICEEKGLKGSEHADFSRFQSKEALVLDSSMLGKIVNRSTDNGRVKYAFHPNGESEDQYLTPGLRTLKAAARATDRIPCGQVDENSIIQIAEFSGIGQKRGAGKEATFTVTFKSFETTSQRQWMKRVDEIVQEACEAYGVSMEKEVLKDYQGLKAPADLPLIGKIQAALIDSGEPEAELVSGTGGCDGTWIAAQGIDVVNFGTGMSKIHTTEEFLPIDQMERAAKVAEALMLRVE